MLTQQVAARLCPGVRGQESDALRSHLWEALRIRASGSSVYTIIQQSEEAANEQALINAFENNVGNRQGS